jgi:hypothetical protein
LIVKEDEVMTEDRDYLAEMRVICEEAITGTESPNPIIAQDIVEKLLANDEDLLTGWLLTRASGIVCDYLGRIDHVRRSRNRVTGPGRADDGRARSQRRRGDVASR